MSTASRETLLAHLDGISTDIADRVSQGKDRGDLIELRRGIRNELIERFPCPNCLGTGRVAYGPWGVNPPKKTCPVCEGRRYES